MADPSSGPSPDTPPDQSAAQGIAPPPDSGFARAAPYLALIAAAAFWGGTWTAARGSYQDLSPAVLAFSRWAVAAIVLVPLFGRSIWRHRAALRQEGWRLVLLTAIGAVLFNYMIFRGVQTTTAINGALLNAATPIYIVLLSFLGIGERSTGNQIIGIAIAMVGLIVIVTQGSWDRLIALQFVEGDLWIAAAMFLWGLYSIGVRAWNSALPPLTALAAMAGVAVLLLAPMAGVELALGGRLVLSAEAVYGMVYLGLFASIGSYVFWNFGIRKVGAPNGSLFQYLIPVFAAAFAILILSEDVALYHLAGAVLIVIGILLANRKRSATPG